MPPWSHRSARVSDPGISLGSIARPPTPGGRASFQFTMPSIVLASPSIGSAPRAAMHRATSADVAHGVQASDAQRSGGNARHGRASGSAGGSGGSGGGTHVAAPASAHATMASSRAPPATPLARATARLHRLGPRVASGAITVPAVAAVARVAQASRSVVDAHGTHPKRMHTRASAAASHARRMLRRTRRDVRGVAGGTQSSRARAKHVAVFRAMRGSHPAAARPSARSQPPMPAPGRPSCVTRTMAPLPTATQ